MKWLCLLFLLSPMIAQQSLFTASASAPGPLQTINLMYGNINFHQLKWVPSPGVTACSVEVDTSEDGVAWVAGGLTPSQSCTASGQTAVISGTFRLIRINLPTLSGGTLAVTYSGWTVNPSPATSASDVASFQADSALPVAGAVHLLSGTGLSSQTNGQNIELDVTAASSSAAGILALTHDLGGTAASPVVHFISQCESKLDGVAAGTYTVADCLNATSRPETITGIFCASTGAGDTLNVTDNAGNPLLVAPIVCQLSVFAPGTQTPFVTIPPLGFARFTFVSSVGTVHAVAVVGLAF